MPRPLNIAATPRGRSLTFPATPDHDLRYMGGRTIAHLTYTNLYLGGQDAWVPEEVRQIDQSLYAAMSDPALNNVLRQYFKNAPITTQFSPSRVLAGAPPSVFGQKEVEDLVLKLHRDSQLVRFHLNLGSTVVNIVLPRGTVLTIDDDASDIRRVLPRATEHEESSSLYGLGGYHGSVHPRPGVTVYYAVSVYSERTTTRENGIVAFDAPWKNVVATLYHELCEARTDPDVADAIRMGDGPDAQRMLGWISDQGEEVGDFPIFEAGNDLSRVMWEAPLASGAGTVPVQAMYSNAHHGPVGPQGALCDLLVQRVVVPVLAPPPPSDSVVVPTPVLAAQIEESSDEVPEEPSEVPEELSEVPEADWLEAVVPTHPVASGEPAGTNATDETTKLLSSQDLCDSASLDSEMCSQAEAPLQSEQEVGRTKQPMLMEVAEEVSGPEGVSDSEGESSHSL